MEEEIEMTARPRTDRDLEQIVSWIPDADALFLFSGTRLSWPLTEAGLRDLTHTAGLVAFGVIDARGDLVGHFDLAVEGGCARLGRVIVDPARRGRGYARGLLRVAGEQAGRRGAEVVRLNVVTTNEPAIRAYRRAGFTVVADGSNRPDVTVMECSFRPTADAASAISELEDRFRAVRAAELDLLDPATRADAQRVGALLHPDFVEIGRSGRRWKRAETIAALAEEQGFVTPQTDDWQFGDVAGGAVLVTYRIVGPEASSRHASLWDVTGTTPVLRYHQGTVLPEQ